MDDFKIYTITQDEKQEIISVIYSELEKYDEIAFAYVYGSFVDPEMPSFRDIDIGIYIKGQTAEDFSQYETRLPNLLEKRLCYRYPVDVRALNGCDILFLHNVIQGEIIFVRDEDLWADFVVYVGKSYGDIGAKILSYMKEAFTP